MEVPEHEAFVLHEKRITNFADMARNLNPLGNDDFLKHRNNVITWVEHSGKDYYLAEQLKSTRSKNKFVELLALRYKKEEAKNTPAKNVYDHGHELRNVESKLKDLEQITGEDPEIKQEEKKKENFLQEKVETQEPKKETLSVDYLPKPKKPDSLSPVHLEFEFDDFLKVIEEAEHCIQIKHYAEAVKHYEKLKQKFEVSKLSKEEKTILYNKIRGLFNRIENAVN